MVMAQVSPGFQLVGGLSWAPAKDRPGSFVPLQGRSICSGRSTRCQSPASTEVTLQTQQELCRKWFGNDGVHIQMGRLTRDSFARPNKEPGVAMLLGYSL